MKWRSSTPIQVAAPRIGGDVYARKRADQQPSAHTAPNDANRVPGLYMRRAILILLGSLCALPVSAAPTPPLVGTEIATLLERLRTSGCEFSRNGTWYGAAEAKSHLLLKIGAAGTFQSAEQFIER